LYTYGPVPSRRLGRSLGVSLIPHKTCSYSCVYCQLGRTRRPCIERASFVPREDAMAEIETKMQTSQPDYITFVGDGEPTLSADLGWFIEQCKSRWEVRVAVITNGSLLFREDVRTALASADVVMPSLDAGDDETYRAINRPHPDLTFGSLVDGLMAFRKSFAGVIRLEVMLVRDVNDSDDSLGAIHRLAERLRPELIDIAVPTRPPAERWVRAPEPERIIYAQRLLRAAETMTRPEQGRFDLAGFDTVLAAIRGLSSRHPLRRDQAQQIAAAFGQPEELERLVDEKALKEVAYDSTRFVLPAE